MYMFFYISMNFYESLIKFALYLEKFYFISEGTLIRPAGRIYSAGCGKMSADTVVETISTYVAPVLLI